MKKTAFLITLLVGIFARAASGGDGHHDGAPWYWVGVQAANLGALLIVITYLTRSSIKSAFADRQSNYIAQAEKTKAALKDAEAALKDIRSKLNELEVGETKAIETAKREAVLVSENLVKEAEAVSIKIKRDSELLIAAELSKAKTEINTIILNQAISTASQKLSTSTTSETQEVGFLKQLETVKA
jgi:F-type H+-transporting ATPase subunit b